jgi:hypothetical protein
MHFVGLSFTILFTVFQDCLSFGHGLNNVSFDWQMPVSHGWLHTWFQHATAMHMGRILGVNKSLTMRHVQGIVSLIRHYRLVQWPISCTLPPLIQWLGHKANHQSSCRAKIWIRAAWPSSVKDNVRLQFLLVSLWNRHVLTVLLTVQQRVDDRDFHFLWSSILILLFHHSLTGSNTSKYDLQDQHVHCHHDPISAQFTLSSIKRHISLSDVDGWHAVWNNTLKW